MVRPETMLRRALLAIDPDYARRTEYRDDSDAELDARSPWGVSAAQVSGMLAERSHVGDQPVQDEPVANAPVALADQVPESEDPQEQTQRRRLPSDAAQVGAVGPAGLMALRVAVLPIPEEGDVRLIFLSPGEQPPPGVAVALLVPPSEQDAQLIAELYRETEAKV